MNELDERWLQAVIDSGVSDNVTLLEPTAMVCCCRNEHKAIDGFIFTDAGCYFHGVKSNIGQRTK